MFCFVFIKLEGGFQKTELSSLILGLIRFEYRGTGFIIHADSLWFCGVRKLRWLDYNFFATGLKESKKRVKIS